MTSKKKAQKAGRGKAREADSDRAAFHAGPPFTYRRRSSPSKGRTDRS